MKKLILALCLLAATAQSFALDVYGLRFLSTGDAPSTAFQALQFTRPDINGMPLWGASGTGATWIWKIKYRQQAAYYVAAWHSQGDGGFSGDNFYGVHPYPNPPPNGTAHDWEIAIRATDITTTLGGSAKAVVYNTLFTQALRVVKNGDGTKTLWFYTALPSTANADVIRYDAPSDYGETTAAQCVFTIGDSPWYAAFQHERLSGTLASIKLFNQDIGVSNIQLEAADMTQLKTAAGIASIWWGKNTFDDVDDLTDDYGTGRAFHWAGATKATREFVETAGPAGPVVYLPIKQ